MKPVRKSISQCEGKNQLKLCCKSCWKEQLFNLAIYLMNHLAQTSILFNIYSLTFEKCQMQPSFCFNKLLCIMDWVKHSLSLWVSFKRLWWWEASFLDEYYWFNRFTLKNISNILLTIQQVFFKEKLLFFTLYFDIMIFWLGRKNLWKMKNGFPESQKLVLTLKGILSLC